MEHKSIYLDGVDVSECLFYQSNFEEDYDVKIKHFCSNWHNSCESINNSNCYFKQLARKTQENEELKKQLIQKDKVGTNDIEKSLLYIWSEYVLQIVSVKQYKEIKKLFDEKIKQTITGSN